MCLRKMMARKFIAVCTFLGALALFAMALFGQGNSGNAPGKGGLPSFAIGNRVPLPVDWSFSHVIYTQNFTPAQAARMQHDPRLYNSWLLQGHVQTPNSTIKQGGVQKRQHVDWSFSLGTAGGVAPNMFPAKFNFDVNASVTAANCTSDFVVYGLNVVASDAQSTDSGRFSAAATPGSTITVNGVVFTASADPAATGTFFYVGNNANQSAINFANAVNNNLSTGVTAISKLPSPVVQITAIVQGSAGDGIPVSPSPGSNFTWNSPTTTGGGNGQANLVALENLYSGSNPTGLCGSAPTIKWAYNVTTTAGGKVTTSPVLSLDGTMVAFIESNDTNVSILHVLKWIDNDGTLGQPTIPFTATHISTCAAP